MSQIFFPCLLNIFPLLMSLGVCIKYIARVSNLLVSSCVVFRWHAYSGKCILLLTSLYIVWGGCLAIPPSLSRR